MATRGRKRAWKEEGYQARERQKKEKQKASETEGHEGRGRLLKGCIIPVVFVVVPVCRVVEFEHFIKARLVLSYPNSPSSLRHKCFIHCSVNLATKPRKMHEMRSNDAEWLNTEQLDTHNNCLYKTLAHESHNNTHHVTTTIPTCILIISASH